MRVKELFNFIRARHAIYCRRTRGEKKPWTQDPILQQYRFCNVYRELDAVTMWIAKNWRQPHYKDPHLWFAMVVARLFNLPSTLELIGYPVPFNKARIYNTKGTVDAHQEPMFNGAYIVSTNGHAMDKVEYLVTRVLEPLWKDRKQITAHYKQRDTSLFSFHNVLTHYDGLGSFMAGQVIADLKYVVPLSHAADWRSFAASGPGSRRGLNRVMDVEIERPWNEAQWHHTLMGLKLDIDRLTNKYRMPEIHAQDLQNCLCEFDKYERARLGQGKPKQRYAGI